MEEKTREELLERIAQLEDDLVDTQDSLAGATEEIAGFDDQVADRALMLRLLGMSEREFTIHKHKLELAA